MVLCNLKSVLVFINFVHDDASMARLGVTRDRDKKAHSDVNYVWT